MKPEEGTEISVLYMSLRRVLPSLPATPWPRPTKGKIIVQFCRFYKIILVADCLKIVIVQF
jgi:hypothetical protein